MRDGCRVVARRSSRNAGSDSASMSFSARSLTLAVDSAFPKPEASLATGRVWSRAAIEERRSELPTSLHHALTCQWICQRAGRYGVRQLNVTAAAIWSSTAASKRAPTATTTASPRTHPHAHPNHSDDEDDEDVTSAEATDSEHLRATLDQCFRQ